MKKARALILEQRITATEREARGHLVAWTNAAKEVAAAYLDAIQSDPTITITLTLEKS